MVFGGVEGGLQDASAVSLLLRARELGVGHVLDGKRF